MPAEDCDLRPFNAAALVEDFRPSRALCHASLWTTARRCLLIAYTPLLVSHPAAARA
ncbi:hypothetical protein WOLCODRAFT_28209 [Wolfiporia cocos MD-104 SS10]|uniref:Uncharacterized protein n=1 Tax=Wolfiporia cocos (strain MD-104) TaxID=742152 RepID=A0A2H3JGQ5_WOLCO|nr:hypothetical protein WOLCODRAFT_28209 [Wolfiporia cocos MD-104 SS10]